MMSKMPPSALITDSRPPCSAMSEVTVSGVESSARSTGSAGTMSVSAVCARPTAVATICSRLSPSADAALAAALSAASLASRAVTSASTMTGFIDALSCFSASYNGLVSREKTADLRLAGGSATTV